MRDVKAFVREHIALLRVAGGRAEIKIGEEMAGQLEEIYDSLLDSGG